MVDRAAGRRSSGRDPGAGFTAAEVAQLGGGTDTLTVIGMAYLQQGATREAAEVLDAAASALGPDAGAVAVAVNLGFVRLAEGRVDEAGRMASRVLEDARTSYLDRTMAWLVAGLAGARRRDHDRARRGVRRGTRRGGRHRRRPHAGAGPPCRGTARDVVGDGGAAGPHRGGVGPAPRPRDRRRRLAHRVRPEPGPVGAGRTGPGLDAPPAGGSDRGRHRRPAFDRRSAACERYAGCLVKRR